LNGIETVESNRGRRGAGGAQQESDRCEVASNCSHNDDYELRFREVAQSRTANCPAGRPRGNPFKSMSWRPRASGMHPSALRGTPPFQL
jgi:hypothetical protein